MAHAGITADVHLAGYVAQCPIAFTWVKEVSAQPGHYVVSIGILHPVGDEGIVVFATEILHGIELVHQSQSDPFLCFLRDTVVCVEVP